MARRRSQPRRRPGSLTALDSALFAELQRDGRVPFTALAERLGVSEAHVRRRVRVLTRADVFSIAAVADPRVLGLQSMAWIALAVRHSRAVAVAETLVELPEVDYVVVTSGAANVMAEVACPSPADLYRLLLRLRAIPGVQRTETFVYLNLFRQQFQWTLFDADRPTEPSPTGVRGAGPELDAVDATIIRELQVDGRASFRDLAKRIGVSERVVSARFARLVEDDVLQVIAVGNPESLGFTAMAWLGITVTEGADYEETAAALGRVRGIDYVVVPSGRYDLMAELVARDRDELLGILEDEIGAIEGIRNVETFVYLRLLYRSTAGAWGAARSLAHTRK